MDWTPLEHVVIALLLQGIVYLIVKNAIIGILPGSFLFIGREFCQAEYRWIAKFGQGLRANMPWWGMFDPRAWNLASVLDMTCPILAVLVAALIMNTLKKQ